MEYQKAIKGTYRYQGNLGDLITVKRDKRIGRIPGTVGAKVGWLDCDAETFINHWLPIFDAKNGIDVAETTNLYRTLQKATPIAHRAPVAKPAAKPKSSRYHQIYNLLRSEGPKTTGELTNALGLSSLSTAQKILKANPHIFGIVGEKAVTKKHPNTALWGIIEGKGK